MSALEYSQSSLSVHSEGRGLTFLLKRRPEVEGIRVYIERLADIAGVASADSRFFKTLATRNPSKFRQFTETGVNWLKSVAQNSLMNAVFGHLDTSERSRRPWSFRGALSEA